MSFIEPKDQVPFKCEQCQAEAVGKSDFNKRCKKCGGYMRIQWDRE